MRADNDASSFAVGSALYTNTSCRKRVHLSPDEDSFARLAERGLKMAVGVSERGPDRRTVELTVCRFDLVQIAERLEPSIDLDSGCAAHRHVRQLHTCVATEIEVTGVFRSA